MKNIVSTIIVFGSIFILIVAGAFVFDKFNGFGLLDNVDSSLNSGIKKVLESEEENIAKNRAAEENHSNAESSYIKDNTSDNQSDNSSKNEEITVNDNISNTDIQFDNTSSDNFTSDNENILYDNKTQDNNTPSDNTSDGMSI